MANGGKEKLAPVVSGEYIRKLRISLGLTQLQFAKLMEVGNVTVANWEKNGLDGTKSSSFPNFKYLTTLLKQSMRHPELIPPQKLMRYLKLASNHELMPYYLPYLGEMETDYLNVINSGSLSGVLFALLFDKDLERRGVPSPSEDAEKGLEDLLGPTSAEDAELLEALNREAGADNNKQKRPGKTGGKDT
ncbi:MAG: helix-turn-helix domain-containing protein [Thermovirgaceae bacterium]